MDIGPADTYIPDHYNVVLSSWFGNNLGKDVLTTEKGRISRVLPDLFGYHILQIGSPAGIYFLDSSRINHKIVTCQFVPAESTHKPDLLSNNNALPVMSESMDVVLLPHVLEFEDNPHQILRESERVLIGEGHLVIIGFNPLSFWGCWRLFLAWRDHPPWNGKYISLTRLKDWLTLLDFEIIKTEKFFFRPPLKNIKLMQKLKFMEQLGQYCWPYFGGVYLLVAKKRVVSMTPIKLQWQSRRRMITSGLIEPSARLKDQYKNSGQ